LLGQAVIVQVRASDYAAAAVCGVLGLSLAADIHYAASRDRAGENALLQATGWTDRNLTALAGLETALTAVAGAIAGTVVPLAAIRVATGSLPAGAAGATAAIGAAAIILTLMASVWPVRRLNRNSPARHLAED
jgi:putative ABC transport system permease protein